mgnify:CR=1 FL=1
MKELQIFNSEEFGRIRSVVIDNEPWFVGNDVAKALGYSKVWDAIKTNVDEMDTSLMGHGFIGQETANYNYQRIRLIFPYFWK